MRFGSWLKIYDAVTDLEDYRGKRQRIKIAVLVSAMATGDSNNGNKNDVFVNPSSTTRNTESAGRDLELALTRICLLDQDPQIMQNMKVNIMH